MKDINNKIEDKKNIQVYNTKAPLSQDEICENMRSDVCELIPVKWTD